MSSPPPLVWVTQGKTQHAAHLLENRREGEALIRWQSTRNVEWVATHTIARNLLPRRRRVRTAPSVEQEVRQENNRVETESVDDDDDKGNVEIILTIQPPIPKRNRSPARVGDLSDPEQRQSSIEPQLNNQGNRDDLRSCRRRLHMDTSSEIAAPALPTESETDDLSLDTQEDIVLADLVATQDRHDALGYRISEEKKKTWNEGIVERNLKLPSKIDQGSAPVPENPDVDMNHNRSLSGASSQSHPLAASVEETHFSHSSSGLANKLESSTGEPPDASRDLPYTYQSSAYVQNLAEICYTIMHDQRWRLSGKNKPLFAWEYGDDLGAISTLSQLYQTPSPAPRLQCVCLLCRDSGSKTNSVEDDSGDRVRGVDPESPAVQKDVDVEDSRALNLYCRMYYRKGPWFRIDDIFTKYYSPKRKQYANASDDQESNSQDKTDITIIDDGVFQQALVKMKDMLDDIDHLCARGLLRTFNDEEECGKMAGSVSPEGGGVVLNADERRSVLQKLGGSKKKTNGRRKSDGEKSISPRENEIWKQMCQQQSIAAGMFMSNGKKITRRVLPVRQHVNQEVLSKLASAVILSASCAEYVPAAIFRAKLIEVKKSLSCATEERSTQALNFARFDTAFRAREPPLLALRRCCRLYLCATSGPGDMRGDGTNGWKSTRNYLNEKCSLPLAQSLPRPGDNAWHTTVYPGLSSRFGLTHYGFVEAYLESPVSEELSDADTTLMQQVFFRLDEFRFWELSAEIRANTDYLIELNDMILYDERRKARDTEEEENALPRRRDRQSFLLNASDQSQQISKLHVDFLHLLERSARRNMVRRFCSFTGCSNIDEIEDVVQATEDSISSLFSTLNSDSDDDQANYLFQTDCQKVIFVIAVVATNVLKWAYEHMTVEEKARKTGRCWLRHLWGEGVLAYVLWDCIPILEKRGLHGFASRALEVLVFGSFQPETWKHEPQDQMLSNMEWGVSLESTPIGDIMISRRARGKAIERLMIDYTHILRKEMKDKEIEDANPKVKKIKSKKKRCAPKTPKAADMVNSLCGRILSIATDSGFISFAAIRTIARRTKKPLNRVVETGGGREAQELGLRLCNDGETDASSEQKGYVDWMPDTDQAVAVALAGPDTGVGSRCSYFGFEDGKEDGLVVTTSLNVEELAMEYYGSGRLPVGDKSLAGGSWVGWHDEGGHLRALFRILCAFPILGMDGGCGNQLTHGSASEAATIHLSKYQSAPFDLHVGSWRKNTTDAEVGQSVSGFYNRRKERIDEFLNRIETLTPQDLCDCVHEAIEARVASVRKTRNPNVVLTRDVLQLRTLSMLAAGFGGKHLSAVFRCMLFDYRHYSGGLPDLLLARALYSDASNGRDFVDFGEWVGEAFTAEAKAERQAERRTNFLSDKDDEFLGCSKVGDSGASRSNNRWSRQPRAAKNDQNETSSLPKLPPRLVLEQNERPIEVQCLFVEVKSQNDRLDGRQEDWLNILDRVGNARVCKFVNTKKPKSREKVKEDNNKKK